MPLRSANEEAIVLSITETAAQNWAAICAISSEISIVGLVVEHPAFEVELTGEYDALEIEQLLKCGHVCAPLG
jgi:hypothetical protein